MSLSSQILWIWDPGSEIRDPEKTYSGSRISDPGVKKAPDPGSGSATLGTGIKSADTDLSAISASLDIGLRKKNFTASYNCASIKEWLRCIPYLQRNLEPMSMLIDFCNCLFIQGHSRGLSSSGECGKILDHLFRGSLLLPGRKL